MNRGSGETFLSFPKGVTVFGKMTTLESFSHSANILGSDSAQVVSAPLKSWEAQDRKVLHQNLFFSSRNRGSSIFHPNPDKQCWMWTKRQKHKPPIDGGNMCLKFADRKISFPLNHPHPHPHPQLQQIRNDSPDKIRDKRLTLTGCQKILFRTWISTMKTIFLFVGFCSFIRVELKQIPFFFRQKYVQNAVRKLVMEEQTNII